jgi:hypothetical protein
MIKNDERFNNLASGFQSIVLAIAVIIGGAWTLGTFYLLRQREQAKLELIQIEKQIEASDTQLKKLKYDLKTSPALDIQITGTSVPIPGEKGWFLLSTVSLKNLGNQTAILDLSNKKPFLTYPVSFGPQGEPKFGDVKEFSVVPGGNPNFPPDGVSIRAGTHESLAFATKISIPGLYLLSFRADVSPQELESTSAKGDGQAGLERWAATKFLVVPDRTINESNDK